MGPRHRWQLRARLPRRILARGPLLLSLLLVGAGCVGEISGGLQPSGELGGADAGPSGGADGGPGGIADAGTSVATADAEPAAALETACDDSVDNDGDSLIDCDDLDCAEQVHCGWPTELRLRITLSFEASSLAEFAGYSDCVTELSATIAQRADDVCTTCDRNYSGPYVYGTDTCPAADRPTQGSYGFRFLSDSQRALYVLDAATGWQLVGTATGSAGVYSLTRSDPVESDGYDGGDLVTTMVFTDR